jgi:hypothetical protein
MGKMCGKCIGQFTLINKNLRFTEKKIRYKKIRYKKVHFVYYNSHTLLRTTLYGK